jgi:DNA-binding GntR family transcriptional regulator
MIYLMADGIVRSVAMAGRDAEDIQFESATLESAAVRRLAQRQPLTDDVHDVLIDMLMNHTLAPGTRVNIDALARTLNVSPTPVREALARIEVEGLIVKEPRRGYVVAPLIGLDELRSLLEFRLLIEPAAAAQAAIHATPAEASELQAFARSGGVGSSDDAAVNRLDMLYDATFHDTVAALARNAWLRDSLARLRSHLHMYRLYYRAQQAAATSSEHIAIADAIARHDPEGAADAMRAHLRTAMTRSEQVFASGKLPTGT